MSAVNESIVREFFEGLGFLVRQQRKHIPRSRREGERDADLLVVNPSPAAADKAPPFLLSVEHLLCVERALVAVKGWHTETFSPSVLSGAAEISRFARPKPLQQAARALGADPDQVQRILVAPALPQDEDLKQESIDLLKSSGVTGVIPFRTILMYLIEKTQVNRDYQKSDLLQLIRILKNYGLFRDPQMELFRDGRRRRSGSA